MWRNGAKRLRAWCAAALTIALAAAIATGVASLAVASRSSADASREALPDASNLLAGIREETIRAKIAQSEARIDLAPELQKRLLGLYRQALANLEEFAVNRQRASWFNESPRNAPSIIADVRRELEARESADPLGGLALDEIRNLDEAEMRLQREQAELAVTEARRLDLERRLAVLRSRPASISERLSDAKQEQEDVQAALTAGPSPGETPELSEARQWALLTRHVALSSEIARLAQELRSQPARAALLEAKLEQAAADLAVAGARVAAVSELVNRERRLAAEKARIEAERAHADAARLDPLLAELSEENRRLTEELKAMAAQLDELDDRESRADKQTRRIAADYRDASATVTTGGLAKKLGRVLVEQRESLPDLQEMKHELRDLQQRNAEIGVLRLSHQAEAREIADVERAVAKLEAQLATESSASIRERIRTLVERRGDLLKRSIRAIDFYRAQLVELEGALRSQLGAVTEYKAFIDRHLLWLDTAESIHSDDFAKLPSELDRTFSYSIWSRITARVGLMPLVWMAFAAAVLVIWKRGTLRGAIDATASRVGKPAEDSFVSTLKAVALTLLLAAPVPGLLMAIGLQLRTGSGVSTLDLTLGEGMYRTALHLFFYRTLQMSLLPGGLAIGHLRWPETVVRRLRFELAWLVWVLFPAMLVVFLAVAVNPLESGGMIAKVAFLTFFGGLGVFFFRALKPHDGSTLGIDRGTALSRAVRGLRWALPAYFVVLVLLVASGYIFAAKSLSALLLETLWVGVSLIYLRALAMRWLIVSERRLRYHAAVQRWRSQIEAPKNEGEEQSSVALRFEEPDVDVAALSEDTQGLLNLTVAVAAVLFLYSVWSPLLPALGIFESVVLFRSTATIDGVSTPVPVTLADLGLAIIYGMATLYLAARLPAAVNLVLMRSSSISASGRYTVTSLMTYAVIAIGSVIVLGTIGAQWSQLQWLIAALGVGIGFGLQEIVANFISGLIILFERPIRVGDIITVGDTDGLVTKIRIRATTIRNWDYKELLVPNKEFITSRLLNWTLSNPVTRLTINVGVSYGSDVERALELIREAAGEQPHVLQEPPPLVLFEAFGDNSLDLSLRAFVDSIDHRLTAMTEIHKAINEKFTEAGIVIAFPQRDVHLDTSEPLHVRVDEPPESSER